MHRHHRIILATLFIFAFAVQLLQSQTHRLLLLDKAMSSDILMTAYAQPWVNAGFEVDYRRYHPYLTQTDVQTYDALMILSGRMPQYTSPRITRDDVELMKKFYAAGKGIVLAFPSSLDTHGSDDRYAMNQFLRELRLNIEISELHAQQADLHYRSLMQEFNMVRRHEQWIYSKQDTIALGEIMPLRILRGANVELIAESFPVASFKKGKVTYPGPFQLSAFTGESAPILLIPEKAFHVFGPVPERNAVPLFNEPLRQSTAHFVEDIAVRFMKILEGQKMMLTPAVASSALESRSDSELPQWPALNSIPVAEFMPVEIVTFSRNSKIGGHEISKSQKAFSEKVTSPLIRDYLQYGIKAIWGRLTELQHEGRVITPAKTLDQLDALSAFFQDSGSNLFWAIATPQAFADDAFYSEAEKGKIAALWTELSDQLSQTNTTWFAGMDYRDFRQNAGATVDFRIETEPVWSPLDRRFWRQGFWNPLKNVAKNEAPSSSLQGLVIDTDFYGRTAANSYTAAHEYSDESVAFFRQSARGFVKDSLLQDFLGTPPMQRFAFLQDNGLLPLYNQILMEEVERFARGLRERIENYAPDYCWGVFLRTLPNTWYEYGLLRGLSTPGKPVLLFTYEPLVHTAVYQLRQHNVYVLHALAISSVQVKSNEWPSFFQFIAKEHEGFWLSSAESVLQGEGVRLNDKTITRAEFARILKSAKK
ncbi:MAG: hypothetical protein H6696_01330 [Deferribacteres bacterium]|nr:hypothetical protein [candidate division KSB1 bacterium]MCB9500551.1 hypothetical protein [Deferribacteres bacterium]